MRTERLTISTIKYGAFVESIPQTGIVECNTTVKAAIDELYLDRISKGLKAVASINNKYYNLKIAEVNPTVRNGRFNIEMEFSEEVPDTLVNKRLRLRIHLSDSINATLLPIGSFYKDTGGNWIFVLDSRNHAVRHKIKLGRKSPDYFEVIEGLNPGDRVITSSYESFNNLDSLNVAEIKKLYDRM